MKFFVTLVSLVCFNVLLFGQNKIPESIKTNLVLKPSPKPYESTGFVVEKGVTLTIMPGTKIKMSIKAGEKANFPIIDINGTLKLGASGSGKGSPVVFEGTSPMFRFNSAILEIKGLEADVYCVRFFGNNNGYVKDCKFLSDRIPNHNYSFLITVPKTGNLLFQDCLIENQSIDLQTDDFPNDLDNLSITKCAFTTKINAMGKKKYYQNFTPQILFAYGTKCDIYIDVKFKAFDWVLKKPVVTEWFFHDELKRKTTEDSVKLAKGFSMKLPAKAFTNFKQEELPPEKEEKK